MGEKIRDIVQTLFSQDKTYSLRSRLIKGSTGTFGLKVVGIGLSLFISVLLARLLGVKEYGAYAYAMSWVGVLSIIAALGMDRLLVRNVAAYQTQSAWEIMRGLLRRANHAALLASIGLMLLSCIITMLMAGHFNAQMLNAFRVALIILPLSTLTCLRQAAMQGLHHVVKGQLPAILIRPLFFIGLLGLTYLLFGDGLTAPWALGMNAVAWGGAFIIGTGLLGRILPYAVKKSMPVYQTKMWAQCALSLLLVSGISVINSQADMIMLGAMKGPEAAGIYAVVKRGAEFIAFVLFAVNISLAPAISSLYAAGDMKRLQSITTKSARAILLFSLPIAIVFIFFGYWFLLLFGSDFVRGETALAILSAGQLINAAMGSVGLLLIMTGHERDTAVGMGISAVLNIILNTILIPEWGIQGAAAATASSMTLWNILLCLIVWRRLGIHSTAIGRV